MVTLKLEVYVQEGGVARVERYPDTSCPALLDPPTQLVPIATSRIFVNRQAVQTSNVKVTVFNPGQTMLCIRKGEELGLVEIQKRQFNQAGGLLSQSYHVPIGFSRNHLIRLFFTITGKIRKSPLSKDKT
jgi:hypothetical protein